MKLVRRRAKRIQSVVAIIESVTTMADAMKYSNHCSFESDMVEHMEMLPTYRDIIHLIVCLQLEPRIAPMRQSRARQIIGHSPLDCIG